MKVNLYGNVCNFAYVIAKFLRERGIDAILFLERGSHVQSLPESEDHELEGNYPDWIKLIKPLIWQRYGVGERKFIKDFGNCDIIHTFGYGPIWAPKTGRPFVFQRFGADFDDLPFLKEKIRHRIVSWRQRKGLRKANFILITNFNSKSVNAAREKLKIDNSKYRIIPIPIDANKFKVISGDKIAQLKSKYNHDFIFFHPTRQIWSESMRFESENKGNDRLFRAYSRFLKETARDALLIAVARGSDLEKSKALIKKLEIEKNVQWVPAMPRYELIEYYNLADITFDHFIAGEFGGCTIESLSCGTPVFVHLDNTNLVYPENPPVVNVSTEDEIYEKLVELTNDRKQLQEIGRKSREWILKYHHWESLIDKYIAIYEEVLATN